MNKKQITASILSTFLLASCTNIQIVPEKFIDPNVTHMDLVSGNSNNPSTIKGTDAVACKSITRDMSAEGLKAQGTCYNAAGIAVDRHFFYDKEEQTREIFFTIK